MKMDMIMKIDIEKIREDFPILKYKTYLNTAGHSPIFVPVWQAIKNYWQLRVLDATYTLPNIKKEAAKLINAREEEICYINRVTPWSKHKTEHNELEEG